MVSNVRDREDIVADRLVELLTKDPKGWRNHLKSAVSDEFVSSIDKAVEEVAKKKWDALDKAAQGQGKGLNRLAMGPGGSMVDIASGKQLKGMVSTPDAKGAAFSGRWKGLGEFAKAMHPDVLKFGADPRFSKDVNSGPLAETTGSAGGFTVPEDLRTQLMFYILEGAVIRPRAFVLPCTTSTTRVPIVRDTTHADGTVYGGVVGQWTGEAGSVSETQPTFGQASLISKKLTMYTAITNELLRDNAIGLEAILFKLFGDAATFFEESVFFNGIGDGQPLGIVNSPATVSVNPLTGQTPATIVYRNLSQMYSRLLPRSMNNCVWLAHPDCFPQFAELSISVGVGGGPVWISWGGATDTPPTTIFGRPVFYSEHCQAVGTPGDLILADLSYYLIGDRQEMEMMASDQVRFTSDQVVYRFVERLDARPWLDSPITPEHGTNARSPFVILGQR